MEKMIHEYLNLLAEGNKDFLFDSDKRKDLIDFANSINKLRRFSLSVNVSGRLRIHIENNGSRLGEVGDFENETLKLLLNLN